MSDKRDLTLWATDVFVMLLYVALQQGLQCNSQELNLDSAKT